MADKKTISVKVGKVPGTIQRVTLKEKATVKDALKAAGITDHDGYQLRVNLDPVTLTTVLKNDQAVMLLTKVKGN